MYIVHVHVAHNELRTELLIDANVHIDSVNTCFKIYSPVVYSLAVSVCGCL